MRENFIGRTNEINQILAQIAGGPPEALISLFGPGGVGKTSLASQVIVQIKQANPGIRCAVIDFDLRLERSLNSIKREIAAACEDSFLETYLNDESMVERLEKEHVSMAVLNLARDRAQKSYDHIVQNPHRPRLFLVFDTLERIQKLDLFQEWLKELKILKNVVILVCGRTNDQLVMDLQKVYGGENCLEINLKPFSLEETKEYFRSLLSDTKKLRPTDYEKLWILTQGKPIYLDLAATWILESIETDSRLKKTHAWPGRDLLSLDLEQIKQNKARLQQEFSFEILNGIRQLTSHLDWAVLYMALLERPISPDLWQYLLSISHQDAVQLNAELLNLFFVRANGRLHDEMRELLLDEVWPYIDPEHKTQNNALARMIQYVIDRKAAEFTFERAQQEADELSLRLHLDLDIGYNHFLAKFDKALAAGWINECRMLLDAILSSRRHNELSEQQQNIVLLRRDQLQNYEGRPSDGAIERDYGNVEETVLAYCTVAYGLRDVDPDRAAAYYQQALEIVQEQPKIDEILEARVLNWQGMVLRRLGMFDQAIEVFKKSIELRSKHGLELDEATAQNNLAYIYRQKGNLDLALILARKSFVTRQAARDQNGMAYSLRTIAELYRDQNDVIGSQSRFLEARQIFKTLENEAEVASVDVELANLARKMHDPVAADQYFDEALEIFLRINDREGLGYLKNERGCELRKRARECSRSRNACADARSLFDQAHSYFQDSIAICQEMHNWYRLADNLADLALLYCYELEHAYRVDSEAGPGEAERLIRLTEQTSLDALIISRRHHFELTESRAIEVLGSLCFIRADYHQRQGDSHIAKKLYYRAFAMYYLPACTVLATYYSANLWRYHLVFDRLNRKILSPTMPPDIMKICAAYLARRWKEEGNDKIAPDFAKNYELIASGAI